MTLSIVIPVYNRWDLAHQLLFDLYKNCRKDIDDVLVINDASPDKTVRDGLSWWSTNGMLPLREKHNVENQGFLKTCNLGIFLAKGDAVLLISTDVRVQDNVCSVTKDVLSANPKTLIGGRLLDWDTGWNTFGNKIFPYLEGWLLGFTKDGWKELSGFDELYAPNDFEDVDISTKALSLGYNLFALNNPRVRHIGGQSIGFNPEREALTKRNQEKFKKKWVKNNEQ